MMNGYKESLKKAVGPLPWYYKGIPPIEGYEWQRHPSNSTIVLLKDGDMSQCRLMASMYMCVFVVQPNYIGMWDNMHRDIGVTILDVRELRTIDKNVFESDIDYRKVRYVCNAAPVACLNIQADGLCSRTVKLPEMLRNTGELFMINGVITPDQTWPYAVYILDTDNETLEVFPQKWFTAEKFDLGYEWITKVTRHQETGRIIGTGIRIRDFVLTEDGCYLERWL